MVDVLQPSPVSRSNVLPSRARALRPPLGREVRTALDLVGDALVFVDRFELQIVDANVAARDLFRVSTGDLYGRTLFDLLPDLDIPATMDAVLRCQEDETSVTAKLQREDDGRRCTVQIDFRSTDHDDNNLVIAIARPLADNRSDRLTAAPQSDPLTGLPARDWWLMQMNTALDRARDQHEHCAVLFIDLNDFKQVNDTFGHLIGDAVLRVAARRIQSCVRQGDVVSRFGGDEFVVLIRDVASAPVLRQRCDRIDRLLHQPMWVANQMLSISAAIGASCSLTEATSLEGMIETADREMYWNKRRRSLRRSSR